MSLRSEMIAIMIIFLFLINTVVAISLVDDDQHDVIREVAGSSIDIAGTGQGPNIEFYEDGKGMVIRYKMDQLLVSQLMIDGELYSILDIGTDSFTGEVGHPKLPSISYLVAVPDTNIEIAIVPERTEILNFGQIAPLQEPSPDVYPQPTPKLNIDDDFYRCPGPYPEEVADISSRGNIGDIPYVRIDLSPINIMNEQWDVEIIRECRIEINWKEASEPINIGSEDPMLGIYERIFCDWNEFQKRSVSMVSANMSTSGNGCEYLIITHPNFSDASRELAAWKNQMGMLTKIFDADQIGTKAKDIREFIQNAYDTWTPRPSYVLLMGDAEFVPTNYINAHSYHGKLMGTDHWYSTVNGTDHYSDIMVGRMPVNDPDEARMVVNKTIKYERDPPDHQGFYENITLAAYFQDNNYDGYADRRFAQTTEETMVFIENIGYTGERIYYASSSVNPQYWNQGTYSNGEAIPSYLLRSSGFQWDGGSSDIDAAIESGSFLLTHRDHGASWGWGDPRYTTSHIPNLDNGDLLPVVFSINCLTGMMDHETANDTYWGSSESFSERFLTREGGGAVGVIGATRVSYSGYNDYFFRGMIDAMFPTHDPGRGITSGLFRMGDVLSYGKNYMANTWGDWILEFELFHYFGDPTMEIWTAEPAQLNVTHPFNVSHGSTLVRVNTSEDGALVCISYDGGIIGRGRSQNGHINITTTPLFAGVYDVTVSGHDLRPYTGIFNVTASSSDLCIINMTGPLSGHAGNNWTYSGIVMNNGGTSATGVNVTLELDGIEVNRTSITALPASGMTHVTLNWTPECDGWHKMSLKVDSSVQEISEDDNEAHMDVRIYGEPNLTFDHMDGIEFWARTGEITEMNYTLGNNDLGELRYSVRPDLLFHDDFEVGILDGEKWGSVDLSHNVVDYAINVPSGSSCISITEGEHLQSGIINTSGFENLTISFMLRTGGFHYTSEPYDHVYLEYLNESLNWISIFTKPGVWYMEGLFSEVMVDLPSDAAHSDLQFRFTSASTGDYFSDGPTRFYIDDVALTHETPHHFLNVTNGDGSIGYGEETDMTVVVNGTSLPPGLYNTTIFLVTNDPIFKSFPVNVSVEIRENITPIAEAGSDVIIGQHETVSLDGSNSTDNTGIINWTWRISDHDIDSFYYEEVSEHTFHEAGTFTAELTVHDYALNYAWNTFTITVLDTTDPVPDAGVDLIIDQHETVMFNGSGSFDNVGIVNYTWEFTDGSEDIALFGASPSHAFHEAGQYSIELTVRDAIGNNGADIIDIEVRDITPPEVDAGPDIVADQYQIFLLNGSMCTDNVGIVNWTWTIQLYNGNVKLNGMTVEHFIPDAGSFDVELNVSDGSGNFNRSSLSVEVRDITPPTVITQGNVTVDQFSTLVLNGSRSSDNVGLMNFTWVVRIGDDEKLLYGPSPSIVFNEVGEFEVVVEVLDTYLNVANSSFTITVLDRECPEIICDRILEIDQHQELVLNASGSSDNMGITNYTWYIHLDLGTIVLFGEESSIVIDEAGMYVVDLNISDAMGNWALININVTVHDITCPVPGADLDTEIYSGNSTIFNASISEDNVGIVQYQWSFRYEDQDVVLEGQEVNYTFDIPGVYNITLTIRDAEGNEAENTYNITVLSSIVDGDDDDDTDDDEDDQKGSNWALFALISGVIILLPFLLLIGLLIILRNREDPESWEDEE